ncbi:MAG: PAS domain S-box protein, partial [Cytophagaceae bacterium]|nr:PAS domain S-box protein [Gemmatimonadaceae bacterium]
MSPNSAGAFLLLATSLLLRRRGTPRALRWSDASAAVTVFIALVSCVGYAYGAFVLTTLASQNQIAVHASILMLVVALGVAALRPFGPVMRAVASAGPGGELLRRMVPLYLAVVVALGWFRLVGQRRAYFGPEVGVALMVVLAITLFAVISWRTAAALERSGQLHLQAEDALRESERRFRVIVNATFDSIIVTEGGVIREANAGSSTIFGYDVAELLGRSLVDLMAPESRPLIEVHARGDTQGSYEVVGISKDGSRLQLEAVSRVHASPAGGRVIMALRDITAQRNLEMQFRQAQKMEAVGRLAGGVAHDFNNLLTIITSYTTFALQDVPPGDPRASDLEQILDAAGSAAALTRQLLAFSRQQPMELKVLELNTVVAGAQRMLDRVIGEDVELRTSLAKDLRSIRADPGQVEQVIMNLAVNARDAMPDGGALVIETSNADLDVAYSMHHDGLNPGPYVLLVVSDTGLGMDERTRQRIFEPFFTTKETGSGTGLGLSTSIAIVKSHGGFIHLYSEPGNGTTF